MKRPEFRIWALLVMVLLVVSSCSSDGDDDSRVEGSELHASPEGDDSASGSESEPFATISKCAEVVEPGQTCVVHAGTYRETVRPANSGTADAPIRFVAEGEVTVTGTDVLEGWEQADDGAYETTVDEEITQLFVGDQLQVGARWPNLEGTHIEPDNFALMDGAERDGDIWTITDADLEEVGNEVIGRSKAWVLAGEHSLANHGSITQADATTFTTEFEAAVPEEGWGFLSHGPAAGDPYFLYDDRGLLDVAGEWFYDGEGGTVSVMLPDGLEPEDVTIAGRTRVYAFDLADRSNIEMSGFTIHAGSVLIDGDDNQLDTCKVFYATPFFAGANWNDFPEEGRGVEIAGDGNVVRNCEIAHTWGNGIGFEGDTTDTVIADNIIHDVGWAVAPNSFIKVNAVRSRESSVNDEVTRNTLCGAGRMGVTHTISSEDLSITHNDISRVGMIGQDLGAIFSHSSSHGEDTVQANTEIAWNRIHDFEEALHRFVCTSS